MFSNDLKNVIKKKFNLTESIINSSKHYKIPRFVFKAKSVNPPNKYNFFKKIFKWEIWGNKKIIKNTIFWKKKRKNDKIII